MPLPPHSLSHLHIKAEIHPGTSLATAATQLQRAADALGIDVSATFNGVTMVAVPGGSSTLLADRQQAEQMRKPRVTSAA